MATTSQALAIATGYISDSVVVQDVSVYADSISATVEADGDLSATVETVGNL